MNTTIVNIIYVVLTIAILALQHYGIIPGDLATALVGILGLHAGSINTATPTPVTASVDMSNVKG